MYRLVLIATVLAAPLAAQGWTPLFNGKDLTGWESRGDGVWTILPGGILVGERNPDLKKLPFPLTKKDFDAWLHAQAWLYTKDEFTDYDLSLEYRLRAGGNSGISIRDTGRAQHAVTPPVDFRRTPSKVAYEIQINNGYPDPTPTGSIYGLMKAKTGAQIENQWNRLEIESRADVIRVRLNGQAVAEHPGDPQRPKSGPIGLQLHDQMSTAMFRNIKIRKR